MARALRADAERSVRAILEAAERVLGRDPSASMEQIAEAAGLTRITVHRRFANRQALLDALAVSAARQLLDAIEEARPDIGPALVAFYRVTGSVLRVKSTWRFAITHATRRSDAATALWVEIDARSLAMLKRAQGEGLLAADADLDWARQVYYALVGQALDRAEADGDEADRDPDVLSTLVIDTLLHGAGPRG
ncbi:MULTISPECIES: TetR/AcrR family transcriptional regulator [unclassified Streptomyces]|uniref:TetR/AcrR family transcriptional regulator n=1 Tax=unclassified Streptomyces TaxID=2593676 RepID=UPI003812B943